MNGIDKNIFNSFGHYYWDEDSEDSEDFQMGNSDSDQFAMVHSEDSRQFSEVYFKDSEQRPLFDAINEIGGLPNETYKANGFKLLNINELVQKMFDKTPELVIPFRFSSYTFTCDPLDAAEKTAQMIEGAGGKALFWNACANALSEYGQNEIASKRFGRAINQADTLPEGPLKTYIDEQIALSFIEHGYIEQAIERASQLPEGITRDSVYAVLAWTLSGHGYLDLANIMADKLPAGITKNSIKNRIIQEYLNHNQFGTAITIADNFPNGEVKDSVYERLARYFLDKNHLDEAVNVVDKIKNPTKQYELYQSIYLKLQSTRFSSTSSDIYNRMKVLIEKMNGIQRKLSVVVSFLNQ